VRSQPGPVEIIRHPGYNPNPRNTAFKEHTMDFMWFIGGIVIIGIALFFLKQSAQQGD
jgi:hypothetical protein